ncbi:MAG: geranylgeranylglyceryl/heptaprenylglyceryl phosphate synthase, partial [Bacteroidota bacterium]|nr:geranylgeranylglyceryl/heptaprenylglyceryl phosphate synthase [Bacteroidota bacterium]
MLVYDKIQKSTKSLLAVLIDPDKASNEHLQKIANHCNSGFVDLIFVGGSIAENSVDTLISKLKQKTSIPVVIFPGNHFQVSEKADAILFLSLISGRNPEFLIGNHVLSAKRIKNSKIEVIPTGYILIENGNMTSVEYISNTKPIPADKPEIACSTA